MFGALAKSYYAEKIGKKPEDIVVVSVMPCTAKKYEAQRDEMSQNNIQDVDYVLTTRELGRMIKQAGIDFKSLPDDKMDTPFGISSGAADIFANTGGVMEAAVRTVYEIVTGRTLPLENLHIEPLMGLTGLKKAKLIDQGLVFGCDHEFAFDHGHLGIGDPGHDRIRHKVAVQRDQKTKENPDQNQLELRTSEEFHHGAPPSVALNRLNGQFHHLVALPDRIDHIHSLDHLAEHRVLSVQVWLGRVGDEELAAVGARPRIGHGDETRAVLQGIALAFILELVTGAAPARARGIAPLDDEIIDHAVEDNTVVKALLCQEDEIVHRLGRVLGIEFKDNRALCRLDRHPVVLCRVDLHCRRGPPLLGCHVLFSFPIPVRRDPGRSGLLYE